MILFKHEQDLKPALERLRKQGKTIGFAPTMGALHAGHLQLIQESRKAGDITVVSIFVNPTQFNDKKDFEKYPVTIEQDIKLLVESGTDILFLPTVDEMYPDGLEALSHYDLGDLENILEGFYRPGHFQGVCNVMQRLLEKVQPHNLYMGQKDYQQCMVVQKLIADFHMPVTFHIVPTIREESGLALSSRNTRLSANAKEKAVAIYNAHLFVKNNLLKLSIQQLKADAATQLTNAGFTSIDYVEICDAHTLAPVNELHQDQQLVILTAAFIEGVRLIDNMLLN